MTHTIRQHRRTWLGRVLGVTGVCVLVSAGQAFTQTAPRAVPRAADLSTTIEVTASQAGSAVVEIFTTAYTPADSASDGRTSLVRTERGSGSGVVVDPAGYIVTNAHVVRGAQRVRVEIPGASSGASILPARGRVVPASVVGLDLDTDVAVLKIDAGPLPALAFGDSDRLKPGQLVLALGSPLGFHNTVSLGIVSAVARQLELESSMVYIQTDAGIAPGSSGGPLVDLEGRIVGINTLTASSGSGGDRLGFSAPSNIVRSVYEQIRAHGRVRRGDIGVRTQTATPALVAGLALGRDGGAVVADVLPGSPAARAGLRPGDLVVALDGRPMENGRQLQVGLYRRFVGDVVRLDVLRNGQTSTVPVAVSERLEDVAGAVTANDPREYAVPRLGLLGITVSPRVASMVGPLRAPVGVLVLSVTDGAFDTRDGGLEAGDVIHAVNRTWIEDIGALRQALEGLKPGDAVVVQVERRGELRYVAFVAED